MNNNKIKITIKNKGKEDIKGLCIDIKTDINPIKSSLGKIKREYDYVSLESQYILHRGYSKEIVIEFDDSITLNNFEYITICGEKVIEEGMYDNIKFTTIPNYDETDKLFSDKEKVLSLDESKENNITINIKKASRNR